MGRLYRTFIVSFVTVLCACSSKQYEDLSPPEEVKLPDKPSNVLCKYSLQKGIAELQGIQQSRYLFSFFPGNIKFSITNNDRFPESTKIGSEFRATYEALIDGGKECSSPPPKIVDLPH